MALHENDVVIQCIPYIKTCHRMYTKIFWAFMRLQGQIPHHYLLDLERKAVGKCSFGTLWHDGPSEPVEEFICYLYMAPDVNGGVDKARADIFRKGKKELDHLPPTSDALQLHAMCANYQSKVIWWMAIYGHWIGSCMVNITCSSKGVS